MRNILLLLVFTTLLALHGCATIIYGEKQAITFESDPPGATVVLSTGMKYTTPYTMQYSRSSSPWMTFKKEGYESQQIELSRNWNVLALLGNIITLGLGFYVDVITGAAWTYEPEHLSVNLTKDSTLIK